jgi:hypothetical protein
MIFTGLKVPNHIRYCLLLRNTTSLTSDWSDVHLRSHINSQTICVMKASFEEYGAIKITFGAAKSFLNRIPFRRRHIPESYRREIDFVFVPAIAPLTRPEPVPTKESIKEKSA